MFSFRSSLSPIEGSSFFNDNANFAKYSNVIMGEILIYFLEVLKNGKKSWNGTQRRAGINADVLVDGSHYDVLYRHSHKRDCRRNSYRHGLGASCELHYRGLRHR